jgi:hypothetical protein
MQAEHSSATSVTIRQSIWHSFLEELDLNMAMAASKLAKILADY